MKRSYCTGLVVLAAAFLVLSATTSARADDCGSFGGALVGGECRVSNTLTKSGTFNFDGTLHFLAGGVRNVPQNTTLTLNVGGDFIMDGSSKITSLSSGSCTGSIGGNIAVAAGGNVNIKLGAEISTIHPCGRGEIDISGIIVTIDGKVRSEGTTTQGRGGPINVKASCDLTVTGEVVSIGKDPGADRVHLEGGCNVDITGLVASTGPGHQVPPKPANLCNTTVRPDKPSNSTACVEIWAGDSLTIDRTGGSNKGQVHADTAGSGGTSGLGWVDLFSRGPIAISGPATCGSALLVNTCFAVHANQKSLTNGHGGLITVKSIASFVAARGLAIQASATDANGGAGGHIIVEAKLDVDLKSSELEAAGTALGGGSQHGGRIDVRSFGTAPSTGSILGDASALLDVHGRTPPDGVVNLTACGTIDFPPGSVSSGATVNKDDTQCGGTPSLEKYVELPLCVCACLCTTGLSAPTANGNSILTIFGKGLGSSARVVVSQSCDPLLGIDATINNKSGLACADGQVQVTLPNPATGAYRVIVVGPDGSSSCTAQVLQLLQQ